MKPPLKALTIQNPWLYAITDLDKRIENRTWKPPASIIGKRIALHASKQPDPAGIGAIYRITNRIISVILPYGKIVATAKVLGWIDANCQTASSPELLELMNDRWFFGPIGWVLADVEKVDPVDCKGALGLWDVPENVLRMLVPRR
jgi:hypothetical protein